MWNLRESLRYDSWCWKNRQKIHEEQIGPAAIILEQCKAGAGRPGEKLDGVFWS